MTLVTFSFRTIDSYIRCVALFRKLLGGSIWTSQYPKRELCLKCARGKLTPANSNQFRRPILIAFRTPQDLALDNCIVHSEEDFMVGKTISHYEVIEKIGQGGMGRCIGQ